MIQIQQKALSNKSKRKARNPFSREEDARLLEIVNSMGNQHENWKYVAEKMMTKTARQCRERWVSYLNPNIRIGKWTKEEDRILLDSINKVGKKWSLISLYFDGRSGSDIKNRWHFHLKDITFVNDDNKLEFINNPQPYKTKRRIKIVSAYEEALNFLEQKHSLQKIQTDQSENLVSIPEFETENHSVDRNSQESDKDSNFILNNSNNNRHIILPSIYTLINSID